MPTVAEHAQLLHKHVTVTQMLVQLLWIALSLVGVTGARAPQLVEVARKVVAVPLLDLLLTVDILAQH
jgi:hypothetical protein